MNALSAKEKRLLLSASRTAFAYALGPGMPREIHDVAGLVDALGDRLPLTRERMPTLENLALERVKLALDSPDVPVRSSWPLEALLPRGTRRKRWARLRAELGNWVPRLREPTWVHAVAIIVVSIVAAVAGIGDAVAGVSSGTVTVIVSLVLTTPLRTILPEKVQRVGDLVDELLCRPRLLMEYERQEAWTRGRVLEVVRALARRRVGVTGLTERTALTKGARFD